MKWLALVTSTEMTACDGQFDAVDRDGRAWRWAMPEAERGLLRLVDPDDFASGLIDPAAGDWVRFRYLKRDDAGEERVDQAVEFGDAVPLRGVPQLLQGDLVEVAAGRR